MEICTIVTNSVHFYFGKKVGNVVLIHTAIMDWLKASPNRLKMKSNKQLATVGNKKLGCDEVSSDSSD
ncbi:unnamed protein product [Allacma fusca]|uniref:Uncharacterized protein n=1 Tax=Allacma fusca TaxID=39272 RepID=A0A8J2J7T6_9HEXA|nr:unnamed protein product [Allacma fusca]